MGGTTAHRWMIAPRLDTSRGAATLIALGSGLTVTVVVAVTGVVPFGSPNPEAHLVLETVNAGVALLAAYLVYGRMVRSRQLQDQLLFQGLLLLALAGLALTVAFRLAQERRTGTLDVWLPLAVRTGGFVLVAIASVLARPLARPVAWWRWAALPVVFAVACVVVLTWLEPRLPVALDPTLRPAADTGPVLVGHPLLIGAQASAAICLLVAAFAFTVRTGTDDDVLVRWLGPFCALAGVARVNYVVFPSIYSDWLYLGDIFRTAAYLVLLIGATREIQRYWTLRAETAVEADRRRLARELHDGVLQELVYIRATSSWLGDSSANQSVVDACDRAMDEARQAVNALGDSGNEPLGFVLHRAARQVAERHQVTLELDVDDSIGADHDQRHALVRITREAIANAARHGGARRITLQLAAGAAGRCLVIGDDGSGFDRAAVAATGTGFGLRSMRERAEALPGDFQLDSQPGRGTSVTVRW